MNSQYDSTFFKNMSRGTSQSSADGLFIGFLYILPAAVFLFLQISIQIVFQSYTDYRKNVCYRCMFIMSLTDSIQLIAHIYGGVTLVFNGGKLFGLWVEKIIGGFMNSAFITGVAVCAVLGINRLLIFFTRQRRIVCSEVVLFNALVAVSSAIGCAFFGVYLTPECSIIFHNYGWIYDDNLKYTFWVKRIEEILLVPLLFIPFMCYFLSVMVIVLERRKRGNRGRNLTGDEACLLSHCILYFAFETTLIACWHFHINFDFDKHVTINFLWIVLNGINPLLYMLLNTMVRRRARALWRGEFSMRKNETTLMQLRANFRVSASDKRTIVQQIY